MWGAVCKCVCAQPGSFTQAVVRGLWVVIEDVDVAPPEILAALEPLLHHRRLLLPGSGVTLHAAPGFQLIGTVRTDGHGGSARGTMGALAGAWARLVVTPPAPHELLQVLGAMHPSAHDAGVAALVSHPALCLTLLLHCKPAVQ
jgi:midasin